MATIIAFGAAAIWWWLMVSTLLRQSRKNALSRHRFALIFASAVSGSILLLFFVNLILGGLVPMTIDLIGLGVGIGALNFLLGYPIAYFLEKRFGDWIHTSEKRK